MFIRDMKSGYNKPVCPPGTLTVEFLRWALKYEPDTGRFIWLRHRYGRTRDGSVAGHIMEPQGYIRITVNGRAYLAHRLAYFYQIGTWPPEEIDHINMVRDDNRWVNLRPASRVLNLGNRHKKRDGLKGVFQRPSGRWGAQILGGNSNRIVLGTFDTEEEAHEVYRQAAIKHFGEYARFE